MDAIIRTVTVTGTDTDTDTSTCTSTSGQSEARIRSNSGGCGAIAFCGGICGTPLSSGALRQIDAQQSNTLDAPRPRLRRGHRTRASPAGEDAPVVPAQQIR